MSLLEQSQNPSVPAVQGIADTTNQGTAGVGVFGCVGLPDAGLSNAPTLSFVGVYGSTVVSAPTGPPAGAPPGTPPAIGVYGASSAGFGVYGISATSIGIKGESQNGIGIYGLSVKAGIGIQGESQDADAVNGLSHSNQHAGVSANNDAGGYGLWANSPNGTGIYGHSTAAIGVQGESQDADAVNGLSHSNQHAGVSANNDAGGYGLWANSPSGTGIWAKGTPAGYFDGDVQVTGTITVGTDIIFSNAADFAEDFDLKSFSTAEPGTVMVLGEHGGIEPSQSEYDRKVAGVISGAGDYKPGLILDRRPTGDERGTLALVGKVFCKVDAAYGGIRPGDMLTTSPTPGYAMRADDPARAFGSVIGKALGRCESGRGLVPILIALQ
jgi:hypothetical protein